MITDEPEGYARGKITVTFKEGVDTKTIEHLLGKFEHERTFPTTKSDTKVDSVLYFEAGLNRVYTVRVPAGEEQEVMMELRRNNQYVENADKIPLRYALDTP